MRNCFLLVFVLFAAAFAPQVQAQISRIGNDLNGEGVSDIIIIAIAADGALNWKAYSGADGSIIREQAGFGKAGNHIAAANWLAPNKASLAYVELSSGRILWSVLKDDGAVIRRGFGVRRDLVMAGADFNANGFADAAVVRTGASGRLLWLIKPDYFAKYRSAGTAAPRKPKVRINTPIRFGKKGDYAFFASRGGHGDWLGVVREHNLRVEILMRSAQRRGMRHFYLDKAHFGQIRPLPLRRTKGPDLLAFARRVSGNTSVSFVNMRGQVVRQADFLGSGELLVGNFNRAPIAQLLIQSGASFSAYNPLSAESSTLTFADGIAVDDININRLVPAVPVDATPTPGRPELQDNPPPPAGSIAQICTRLHPFDRSVLYKPASQDTGDSREGKPGFLWYEWENHPWVRKLYVLASNGALIGSFGYYLPGGPPWVRYYSGYLAGTGDTGAALATKARAASGSATIYFYTKNGNCWGGCANPLGRCGGR